MKFSISDIQKEHFTNMSGYTYEDKENTPRFKTEYPYNNREWDLSPWVFAYVFNQDKGTLICELSHRMTNNRVYGWYQDGTEVEMSICKEIFPLHL